MRVAPVALVALLTVALAGCPASAPKPPTVDPAAAARYSAELTAAQVDQQVTLDEAEAARVAGTLKGDELEMVRKAGKALDSAVLRFHAELQLFLRTGVESDAFNRAHAAMTQARANFALVWQAAKREGAVRGSSEPRWPPRMTPAPAPPMGGRVTQQVRPAARSL